MTVNDHIFRAVRAFLRLFEGWWLIPVSLIGVLIISTLLYFRWLNMITFDWGALIGAVVTVAGALYVVRIQITAEEAARRDQERKELLVDLNILRESLVAERNEIQGTNELLKQLTKMSKGESGLRVFALNTAQKAHSITLLFAGDSLGRVRIALPHIAAEIDRLSLSLELLQQTASLIPKYHDEDALLSMVEIASEYASDTWKTMRRANDLITQAIGAASIHPPNSAATDTSSPTARAVALPSETNSPD